jgi:hypothetical protein
MINRIISSLPFNPSLVEELSFYSKRLRNEQSIRRLGLIMVILSLLVQGFAAAIPTEKSLAQSNNHIINGVKTKQDILRAWDSPGSDIPAIYGKFGITRKDIANLPNRPNAKIKSNASNFWSIGRQPLTGYSDVEQRYKNQDIAIKTDGPTVFLRPLRAWDTNVPYSTYEAFRGRNSTTGETFWILTDCGNYAQNGPGRLPPPKLEVKKTIVGNRSTVKPGGTVKFRIEYRNRQTDSLAEDVRIVDNLQREKFNIVSPDNLPIGRDGKLEKNVGNLRYTEQSHIFDIVVRVKNNLRNGTQICNSVRLTAGNAPAVTGGGSPTTCIKVSETADTPVTSAATATSTPQKPATASVIAQNGEIAPGLSKEVKNITQELSGQAALDSTVQPGDVVEYSLITYNSRNETISDYDIRDFVGDVADYADIDRSFLAQQDGTYNDKTKEVVWSKQKLVPGEDNIKKFRVKIKDPVPITNSPSNVSTNFDCKISNEYGNELTMELQCPIIKSVETLPNTGPGAAIGITFGLVSFSGYFLARNKLLSKEILIIRKDYASSGDK